MRIKGDNVMEMDVYFWSTCCVINIFSSVMSSSIGMKHHSTHPLNFTPIFLQIFWIHAEFWCPGQPKDINLKTLLLVCGYLNYFVEMFLWWPIFSDSFKPCWLLEEKLLPGGGPVLPDMAFVKSLNIWLISK